MGCSASKQVNIVARNSEDCSSPLASSCSPSPASYLSNSNSPVPRSLSLPMPLVHHPPTRKGDTHHLVSLTSTTYGSLLLIDQSNLQNMSFTSMEPPSPHKISPQDKLNQTQARQSLTPDCVINTWELMDGLDDDSKDTTVSHSSILDQPTSVQNQPTSEGSAKKVFESPESSEKIRESKPLWQHLSEEALLAKLDPDVAWSYRRALSSRRLGSSFSRGATSTGSSPSYSTFSNNLHWSPLQGTEDKIVVYFTSLRGIRKTFEDCCAVRMILRGFRVAVDEKDISMDSSYRKELQNAVGGNRAVRLPEVFIRGKHVGGAEEIKKMNESGELATLLMGLPEQDREYECENCGGVRFVPCLNCNGSRKVFEQEEAGLRRCPDCNENGLIRCPACCS
ncbi:uncharacterized protein At3g28850-like [Neltuma alba]|uniref:uncharacterized protein At3g28850-like n=1 Tax=Neltuma alba TaxID=207710 RepID=UPI0010A524E4|nr:uncharacterized protein At3g28850-like [Prosopis alba]